MSKENDESITGKAVELPAEFEGRGQHSGWKFRQVARTDYGYVYERSSADVSHRYYEVFKFRIAKSHVSTFLSGVVKEYPDMVSYPGDSAFGDWAWCCGTLERANEILKSFECGQS
jgi:hypothetical protein